MLKFISRRLIQGLLVVLGISILIFIIARVIPGDPARMALGENAPQEAVESLRRELHLDEPIYIQYYYWLSGVMKGDFGRSLVTHRAVLDDIKETLPATLEIVFFGGLIMTAGALLIGSAAAWSRDNWIDGLIRTVSYVCIAIPGFVAAAVAMLAFGYYWPILPVTGRISASIPIRRITGLLLLDSVLTFNPRAFVSAVRHLILPSIAVTLAPMFQAARITRSSMIDNINKDFVAAVRGYGVPERVTILKYLLKPSAIPAVSVLGLSVANIIQSGFLVELIFNWPGLARYGMQALLNKDLNAISAVIVITGLGFALINTVVDIVIARLDPRIRLH